MEGSPQAQTLCLSSRDSSKSHNYSITVLICSASMELPIKKKTPNQNKLLTELCPASSVLCVRSMRISAGPQRVFLFPCPSKRSEHRTNNTETPCFVPEDLKSHTVKLGSPYSAPFNLQAEHLGWSFGQTTGHFPLMPRIPFENSKGPF